MESYFKLKQHNTDLRTEIIAGVTTFFTMVYIVFVNPQILADAGMDPKSVMLATCLSAALGSILTGLMANLPFAQAPGMGLNAFFAYTVVLGMGYTWQQGLAAVFISGVIFFIVAVTKLKDIIADGIPMSVKKAIGAGIGLFIALIGLKNAGLVSMATGKPMFGDFTDPTVLLTIVGLAITAALMAAKVKGALFLAIIIITIIGIPVGVTQLPERFTIEGISLMPTLFQMDFAGLLNVKEGTTFLASVISIVTIIISFTMVDMFDTIGTLIGTAVKGGFLDKQGKLPNMDKAILADAIATSTGAALGTSTVTTYIESAAGISEGGKTGLTAVVVGVLFIVAIILAPLVGIIPVAATSPVLVIVGVLMMGAIKDIDFDDFEEALPVFATLLFMPFTYSITNGIAAGFIFYPIVKMVRGKWNEIHPVMYILAALFILRFTLLTIA
jgi:AGZA family xanthine/uracil permease-like MFS transporter